MLDANVFIQAHQSHYAFDICPGFWDVLVRQHEAKRVCSIDKVRDELLGCKDVLSRWASEQTPDAFFAGTADKAVVEVFRRMANWIHNEDRFAPEEKAKFASVAADGWLVAFAKVNNLVVVTQEEPVPDNSTKIKIPNVCRKFDVSRCDTFEMLRDLGEQFVRRKR